MGLRLLEHMLILSHDPDATRDWFCTNLGLEAGWHPDFGFPVHWLYLGDRAVLHVAKARHSEHQEQYMSVPGDGARPGVAAAPAGGSGCIDHICFACDDIAGTIDRLTRNGVAFNERKTHDANVYQLFLREPVNGIKIELDFAASEAIAAGRIPAPADAPAPAGSAVR
jgi:catechol 2,3-dioxygenase-like lactoylglutathione lyase family enzyme